MCYKFDDIRYSRCGLNIYSIDNLNGQNLNLSSINTINKTYIEEICKINNMQIEDVFNILAEECDVKDVKDFIHTSDAYRKDKVKIMKLDIPFDFEYSYIAGQNKHKFNKIYI